MPVLQHDHGYQIQPGVRGGAHAAVSLDYCGEQHDGRRVRSGRCLRDARLRPAQRSDVATRGTRQ